jgi:hypothetical protein
MEDRSTITNTLLVQEEFKPVTPKYGGIVKLDSKTWCAWTGGKPKTDWSGLKDPEPSCLTGNQYRSTSVSTQQKSQYYRRSGLGYKYAKGKDLLVFQRKFLKHAEEHGLDTVTYIEDPANPNELVSIVTDHGKFDPKKGTDRAKEIMEQHYDSYDKSNSKDLVELLLNSVDETLQKELYQSCSDKEPFIAYWLRMIKIVNIGTSDHFEAIKEKLKNRKMSEYEGENVELICTNFLDDWRKLNDANMYEQKLTMNMLQTIMTAGGKDNNDFKHPLRDIETKLDQKLMDIRHMNSSEQHRAMIEDDLDIHSVLEKCKESYRKQIKKKAWSPALHAKDSKALLKDYGSVNLTDGSNLKQTVNTLVQKAMSAKPRDKSKDFCRICGKPGHWAKDCPKNKGKRNHRQPNRLSKWAPPKPNENEIKLIDGKKKYWCATCKRWTDTHTTDGHKPREQLSSDKKHKAAANVARVSINMQPSAFHVKANGPIGKYSGPLSDQNKLKSDRTNKHKSFKRFDKQNWKFIKDKGIVRPEDMTFLDKHRGVDPNRGFTPNPEVPEKTKSCFDLPGSEVLVYVSIGLIVMIHLLSMGLGLQIASAMTKVLWNNIITIGVGGLSGLTGFGTAYRLYKSIPEPNESKWADLGLGRIRTGPAATKQMKRYFNRELKTNHKRDQLLNRFGQPVSIPAFDERCEYRTASRYNNIGRRIKNFKRLGGDVLDRRLSTFEMKFQRHYERLRKEQDVSVQQLLKLKHSVLGLETTLDKHSKILKGHTTLCKETELLCKDIHRTVYALSTLPISYRHSERPRAHERRQSEHRCDCHHHRTRHEFNARDRFDARDGYMHIPTDFEEGTDTDTWRNARQVNFHLNPRRPRSPGRHRYPLPINIHKEDLADKAQIYMAKLRQRSDQTSADALSPHQTWDEAMSGPQREEWMKAAKREVKQIRKYSSLWSELDLSDTLDPIKFQWMFKQKKHPITGKITYKARLTAPPVHPFGPPQRLPENMSMDAVRANRLQQRAEVEQSLKNIRPFAGITTRSRNEREKKPESTKVLFDSGANVCVTNLIDDFTGHYSKSRSESLVDGLGKGLEITGHGMVTWKFLADNGMYRTIRVPCVHIPTANIRIASTQIILQTYSQETLSLTSEHLKLNGYKDVPSITIPYDEDSNLPLINTIDSSPKKCKSKLGPTVNLRRAKEETMTPLQHPSQRSLTESKNDNLSEAEKELLRWHYKLGHVSIRRVQWMMRNGLLATSDRAKRLHRAAANLTHGVMCSGCQYAKQRRKPTPGKVQKVQMDKSQALKTNDLFPGSRISVDHFVCNPPGRLISSRGKERHDKKFTGGCIFVDHMSGLVHVELQSKLNTHETLQAKKGFESFCTEHGVIPQSYITDKGSSFTSQAYEQHLEKFEQTSKQAGPGAHHANGVAERNIGTVLSIARAMQHHSALHWPDIAQVELWPLALLHAVYIINRIPQESSGRSALELFSRKTFPISKFQDFHVWGSPAYVLDSSLAAGRSIPRWKARSTRCMFVGNSTREGYGMPTVLNLETGAITTQYHVVIDDWFKTVHSHADEKIDFDHDDWYKTFGLTEWQYIPDDHDCPTPEDPPQADSEGAQKLERSRDA